MGSEGPKSSNLLSNILSFLRAVGPDNLFDEKLISHHISLSKFELNLELKFFAKLNFIMCLHVLLNHYFQTSFGQLLTKVRRIRGAQTTSKWSFMGSYEWGVLLLLDIIPAARVWIISHDYFLWSTYTGSWKMRIFREWERVFNFFCTAVNDLRIVGKRKMCLYICPIYFQIIKYYLLKIFTE